MKTPLPVLLLGSLRGFLLGVPLGFLLDFLMGVSSMVSTELHIDFSMGFPACLLMHLSQI